MSPDALFPAGVFRMEALVKPAFQSEVSFDVGALYHGEPEVDLRADLAGGITLPPAGQQILDALAAEEARRLEEELADYTFLPVVAFGITYRR